MIEETFNFTTSPFRLSPDPRFFFGSRSHRKALAYLKYGVQQGEGFIIITGEIGAGKSILIGQLLSELDEREVAAAHLVTSSIEASDIVRFILAGFKIKPQGESRPAQIAAFEEFLLEQHRARRRVLLIVDEAQNLPLQTIEELRMLSNIHYDGQPLFQIFLVGQPEFRETLAAAELEQLRQRVIASYHLTALDQPETRDYILHRLTCAGWTGDPDFTEEAFVRIHEHSGGTPRLINNLCNRILLSCAIDDLHLVDSRAVQMVLDDIVSEEVVDATGTRNLAASRPSTPAAPATPPQPRAETRVEPQPAKPPSAPETASQGYGVRDVAEAAREEPVAPAQLNGRMATRVKELEARAGRLEEGSGRMKETVLLRLERMEDALSALETALESGR